jgi:hypothetical protein
MQQLTNKQKAFKNKLIQKLHTIKTDKGISEDQYRMALLSLGVKSSLELDIEELLRFIALLNGIDPDADMWRKRCMAAIGGWLKSVNRTDNADIIKGIACKATGYEYFNKIPTSRLRDIYYEFSKKAKTSNSITKLVSDEIEYQIISN